MHAATDADHPAGDPAARADAAFARQVGVTPVARDRLVSAIGGTFGIAVTAWISSLYAPAGAAILLAAPVGASTVLLFVVPSSPMSAPWPIIGGAMVSTASGLAMAHLFGATPLGAGLAVGLAIVAMSALRCLHAPGGGYALVPFVAGVPTWSFILLPVGVNALVLVLCGVAFHRLVSGHSYPHRAPVIPPPALFDAADVDSALAELGDTLDVNRADLDAILESAARHARARLVTRA